MLRQTLLAVVVYVFGAVALVGWSLSGFMTGAPREDWALMIVLPPAWIISYWPMLGSLTMAYRIWTIGSTLERIGERIRELGAADDGDIRELEDLATRLAAKESHLPELIVRPFVRKTLARMARDGSLSQLTTRLSAGR